MSHFKQSLKKISAFILDVDGVLTDGSVLVMPDGDQIRKFNIKDGYILQLAVKLKKHQIKAENVLYVGDDIPDYEVMQAVGLACSPSDAAEEIKAISHYVSPKKGGEGCIRDIMEQTLKVQDKWFIASNFGEKAKGIGEQFGW